MTRRAPYKPATMTVEERRAALWQAMCGFDGESWSIRDLTRATDVPRWTAKDLADRLVLGGYATQEKGPRGLRFRLVAPVAKAPPRLRPDGSPAAQGQGQLNMWRAMRIAGEFSPLDLVAYSNTADVRVTLATAEKYCRALARVGFLRRVARPSGVRSVRFRLVRNSGPKPPRLKRDGSVEDPNDGQIWTKETQA